MFGSPPGFLLVGGVGVGVAVSGYGRVMVTVMKGEPTLALGAPGFFVIFPLAGPGSDGMLRRTGK